MTWGLRNICIGLSTLVLLTACGDPLRNVDKLSSVELAEDAATASIAPAATETSGGGFLSRLLGRDAPVAPASEADVAVQAALAEEGVLATPDTESGEATPAQAIAVAEQPKRRGLFGLLRGSQPAATDAAVASAADPATEKTNDAPAVGDLATAEAAPAEPRPRKGLFGLLAGARAKSNDAADEAPVQTASLSPAGTPARNRASARARKGPDQAVVPAGTTLPSGVVARVCDVPRRRLGKEVGRYPERGRGYKMFDSNPGSSAPRPFYITGFDDKCARTFTAALALFGSPTMHEQLRYGLPSQEQPYSTTDKAYEGIKREICGVAKRKPCGAKVKLLEKDTAFVSIYDRFGSNSNWSNILLHKGWVLAADRKG
ncbi:MAG: hypothetical protein AAF891_02420 [Pseudomonadota bacterium]